jgi:hypothetical protein
MVLMRGGSERQQVRRGPEIDHFHRDAFLLEILGDFQSSTNWLGEGHDGDVFPLSLHLCLANGNQEVWGLSLVREREGDSVQELVLKEDDWVGVADRRFEESFAILSGPWGNHLEAGDLSVPSSKTLRMLSSNTRGSTVGSAEDDWDVHVSPRHVELPKWRGKDSDEGGQRTGGHLLSSRVDDMVDSLQREVEGHELDDGAEAFVSSSRGETSKPHLSDWSIDHSLFAILLEEPLGHLVGSLVLGNFLSCSTW